jgi:DnaJ like chaperone protein
MGAFKWITGFLGWVTWGPIGAILGYFAGSAIEKTIESARQVSGSDGQGGGYAQRPAGNRNYTGTEQRNRFFVSLIVLSAAVIMADGRTLQSEVNVVKDFIRRNFGESAVDDAVSILNRTLVQDVNIYSLGGQISANMNYSQRLQLFHYLNQIAAADGNFCEAEKSVLEAIARAIGLSSSDSASIIAMFYKDAKSAYSVLEISPSATDDEVRSAYRRMAMKYHPDKVATLGPEVQKAAEEKFRKIQESYETIKKERGLN